MNDELFILKHLIKNSNFADIVLAKLEPEYFDDKAKRKIFEITKGHYLQYSTVPTEDAIRTKVADTVSSDTLIAGITEVLADFEIYEPENEAYLLDATRSFVRKARMLNANAAAESYLSSGVEDDGKANAIVEAFIESSSDFLGNPGIRAHELERRYDMFQHEESRVPFDLEYFNLATEGGFEAKSLNIFSAISGVGKSALMCHMAAANFRDGKNVIYITLEMSEKKIWERIDSNLFKMPIKAIKGLPREEYLRRGNRIYGGSKGSLMVREFMNGSTCRALDIMNIIKAVQRTDKVKPDIIYVDYLGLMATNASRKDAGSFNNGKEVTAELRMLSFLFEIPIVSAVQVNREGMKAVHLDRSHVAESVGIYDGVDFFCFLREEEFERERGLILVQQSKSRYNKDRYGEFFINFDKDTFSYSDFDGDQLAARSEKKGEDPADVEPIKPGAGKKPVKARAIYDDEPTPEPEKEAEPMNFDKPAPTPEPDDSEILVPETPLVVNGDIDIDELLKNIN
ncbi:DnaB-like helicase C-terminal domain-containing protein [Aureimonas altamirensis]|uniref:DnaB-like helicase C-terminal domain-containing protein n=1 Tax=Aureimonas altamirensis TaxID=370622 RepID=UPI003016DE24